MSLPSVVVSAPLQLSATTAVVLDAIGRIAGLAVLAAAVSGAVAVAFRWYARERVSPLPAVLLGVSVVVVYLNARTALGEVIDGATALSVRVAAFNVSALAIASLAALVGVAAGDRLARTVLGGPGPVAVDESLGRVVRAVGRVLTVELPATIEDVPGYDPIDPETKATLEGKTFVFPRGLTVEELRQRLVRRLREDYRVGHVDVEIDDDGTVAYLGVGARAAGIGPTLPPESAAMAIRADPAHAASAGDLVQVWSRDPHERLLNAEVRGTAGDVVTVAIDAADASKLDTDERYKLVTLPVDERADRELADLLRAADETLGVVEITDGSPLVGTPVGGLAVTVVAVHAGDPADSVEALPSRDRLLSSGDSVYVVARPDAIRRLDTAAESKTDPTARSSSPVDAVPDVATDPTTADEIDEPVDSDDGASDRESSPADLDSIERDLDSADTDETTADPRASMDENDVDTVGNTDETANNGGNSLTTDDDSESSDPSERGESADDRPDRDQESD
ncbi:MAG: hypothetical protein ABEI98_12610 [Halorhabdus sp.]